VRAGEHAELLARLHADEEALRALVTVLDEADLARIRIYSVVGDPSVRALVVTLVDQLAPALRAAHEALGDIAP
jgi:hypothetical protein